MPSDWTGRDARTARAYWVTIAPTPRPPLYVQLWITAATLSMTASALLACWAFAAGEMRAGVVLTTACLLSMALALAGIDYAQLISTRDEREADS